MIRAGDERMTGNETSDLLTLPHAWEAPPSNPLTEPDQVDAGVEVGMEGVAARERTLQQDLEVAKN